MTFQNSQQDHKWYDGRQTDRIRFTSRDHPHAHQALLPASKCYSSAKERALPIFLEMHDGISIDIYIACRQLRWLGHVARMDFDRLPRRMLSSWVPAPRPLGAPKMTYGRMIYKAPDMFFIARATWPLLAADREAWRMTLRRGFPPKPFRRPPLAPLPPPLALSKPQRASAVDYTRKNYNHGAIHYRL